MKKKIYLLFFLLGGLVIFSLFAPDRLLGKNALVSTIVISRAEGEPFKVSFSWPDKIEEGKQLLSYSPLLQYVEKDIPIYRAKKVVGYRKELARQEIALAVLDTQTSLVFEKRYWLETKDIKKGNAIRRYYLENEENLPRFTSFNINEDFLVKVNWWNNFNSDLSISKTGLPSEEQDRFAVVANKFLMESDNLAYEEDKTGQKYSDIIYVPYSQALHSVELVEKGKSFLNTNVEEAFQKLFQSEVFSRAVFGQPVIETISPQFVKNLFLIEQIDPQRIFLAEDGGLKLAERVLVRLGANQEKTFRYTVSKTGASGLGQIMPRTYASIVKAYPSAKLIKDVDIGRVDIQNGIMASILTLDDHLATVFGRMSKAERTKFEAKLKNNPDFKNEIRAAVYNGGPGKYRPNTATISLQVRETVDFVRKYKMVRDLKLFD